MNKQKQKRMIMLVAPLALAAIIIAFFYGLGGGKSETKKTAEKKGINTQLPDALPDKTDPMDKLSIYRQVEKDSATLKEQLMRDPYYNKMQGDAMNNDVSGDPENKLLSKLSMLESQLNNQPAYQSSNNIPPPPKPAEVINNAPYHRPQAAKDSEVEQLNEILTKALDLKYPDRVEKNKEEANNPGRPSFNVDISRDSIEAEGIEASQDNLFIPVVNRFYELDDNDGKVQQGSVAIPAIIDESKSIINGSEVKLRLMQDITIKGITIPAGTSLFAKATFSINRLQLAIENIQHNKTIMPVSLEVYSYDGMPGIPLGDAITEEVAKQGADRGLQALQLTSLNPSIGAQAAAAGIETAKTLISRKTRVIKIKLKGGYPVLLRNTNK